MPHAIGYLRVSTALQAEEGQSLDAQRAKIAAWATLNDYPRTPCTSMPVFPASASRTGRGCRRH